MSVIRIAGALALCAACGDVGVHGPVAMEPNASRTAAVGLACTNSMQLIADTRYFRAFRLADYNIHSDFEVRTVSFIVSHRVINPPATNFPLHVRIHNYTGPLGGATLDLSAMAQIGATVDVDQRATTPEQKPVQFDIPLVAPITADAFVVELHVENHTAAGHRFYLGVNTDGEEYPSYSKCLTKDVEAVSAIVAQGSLLLWVAGNAE